MPNNNSEFSTFAEPSTSRDSPIPLEGEEDALNEIIRYHLALKKPSLKLELLKQTGLFLISSLGVMFYYQPTKIYALSICSDPNYENIPCSFFVNSHITGTLLVAGGILMVATNSFIDQHSASDIPTELRPYLKEPLSRKQRLIENVLTWVGSFVASVPFIIITLVNPIPGLPKFLLYSQAGMVALTNTLLHLLPFKLAFKNKLYRAPFLPIEFLAGVLSNSLLSEEERQAKQLQDEINKNLQILKQALTDHFNLTKRLLTINGFEFTGCCYKNKIVNAVCNINNNPSLEQLNDFVTYFHESSGQSLSAPGIGRSLFRKLAYFLGALWVILACAGFWGGTFNEMTELTGNLVLGTLASFLSIYCLCVLLAFFGGNALQNTCDYLTVWKEDTVKISLAFKLYPKTATLLLSISTYLSFFSYAAGAQLINDNFNDKLDFLRPYLLEIAKTGLIFLGFNAMIDLLINGLNKIGHHTGSEDTKIILQLSEAFNQMGNSIQLMDSNQFLQSLADKDENQLKLLFNIKKDEDAQFRLKQTLLQLGNNLKAKLLLNYKVIDNIGDNRQFIELLNQLHDPIHDPKIIEEAQAYKNVCKILQTLDKINLMEIRVDASVNQDGYASTSTTEITPLLSGSIRQRSFRSIPGIFYNPRRLFSSYSAGRNAKSPGNFQSETVVDMCLN
jgi:hypothetical protein